VRRVWPDTRGGLVDIDECWDLHQNGSFFDSLSNCKFAKKETVPCRWTSEGKGARHDGEIGGAAPRTSTLGTIRRLVSFKSPPFLLPEK
jgi:hypothetical protein